MTYSYHSSRGFSETTISGQAHAVFNIGLELIKKRNFSEALNTLNEARELGLQASPDSEGNPATEMAIGDCLLALNRPDEAKKQFTLAMDLAMRHANAKAFEAIKLEIQKRLKSNF